MIKLFTILFLLYYIFRLLKPNFMVKTMNNITDTQKSLIKYKEDGTEYVDIKNEDDAVKGIAFGLKVLLMLVFMIPITITELIYIFSATQYGNKYITIGYIILWFLLAIIGVIKNKLKKDKYAHAKSFSISRTITHMIDVAYFGYMYYILFLV